MTVSGSLFGRRVELPASVTEWAITLTDMTAGFGLGFFAGWAIPADGVVGMVASVVVVVLAVAQELTWMELREKDEFPAFFMAYSVLPMLAGLVVYLGGYRIAALIVMMDYAFYLHEPNTPDFADENHC